MLKGMVARVEDAAADAGAAVPDLLARAEAAFDRGDFSYARKLSSEIRERIANDSAAATEERARLDALEHKLGRDRATLILGMAAIALLLVVFFTYIL